MVGNPDCDSDISVRGVDAGWVRRDDATLRGGNVRPFTALPGYWLRQNWEDQQMSLRISSNSVKKVLVSTLRVVKPRYLSSVPGRTTPQRPDHFWVPSVFSSKGNGLKAAGM